MSFLCKLSGRLWDPVLLLFFLAVGGWYTLRSGFFQLRFFRWLKGCAASAKKAPGRRGRGLTQKQALCTAMASTIGTGSIAGVATALVLGGPGAVLWMWLSAFVGMMTGFAEKALAVRYRQKTPDGFQGGPMEYMSKGLCKPFGKALAVLFSLACIPASLAGGALVQANSIAAALGAAFSLPPLPVGLVTAALAGAVLFGGMGRVGRLSEKLVPVMAGLFLLGGTVCLALRWRAVPGALAAVWQGAFRPRSALGGWGAGLAMRYGVARGVFTNEAGLGSSAIAHAAADVTSPAQEGLWGMFEVFFATLVVCSITALVILTSGVYGPGGALTGAALSARAFGVGLGPLGPVLVAVCLGLFAFTSLLGWCCYGEQGLCWLWGSQRPAGAFRWMYLGFILLGATAEVTTAWQLTDLANAFMSLPNLTALLLLAPQALAMVPGREKSPPPAAGGSSANDL